MLTVYGFVFLKPVLHGVLVLYCNYFLLFTSSVIPPENVNNLIVLYVINQSLNCIFYL